MQRNEIMQRIIDLETEMFMSVNAEEAVPANTIPAFKEMRRMTYSVLSDKTVALWLCDLETAKKDGRNVMTEKYALIGDQIPTLRDNPQIERIVDIEEKWMNELAFKYPHAVKRERANAELFRKYALCELQTWSPAAVNSYFEDIKKAMEEGRNLAEERYDNLYQNIGKGRLRNLVAPIHCQQEEERHPVICCTNGTAASYENLYGGPHKIAQHEPNKKYHIHMPSTDLIFG